MFKKINPTIAMLLWLLWLVCRQAMANSIAVQDDAGHTVRLAQPARRVVALAPNLTELVFAAAGDKLGSRLVGVSRHSNYPAAAKALPVVADAFAIHLEALSKLKPDLVLVWRSGTPERQRQALKAMAARQGFAVFESDITQVAGIASSLVRLGTLLGSAAVAEQQASAVLTQWQALGQQWTGVTPVRVFFQVWATPLMTLNAEHVLTQAMHRCGGVTGFDGLPIISPTVSKEAVLAFNPELILSTESAADSTAVTTETPAVRWPSSTRMWQKLSGIKAVQTQQVWGLQDEALTRMSPRFLAAAARVCEHIQTARSLHVKQ
jgi:iron complex transport system substrate-binding protein